MKLLKITALVMVLFAPSVQAELVFTAPPRESAENGQTMYAPIARYLSESLGEKVVYRYPGNWSQYAKDMRNDAYDIVFDGPHFAAWRIKHLGHQAAVKLDGRLVFVIVTSRELKQVKKLRHLKKLKVCGLPSPNLGTVSYLSHFANAVVPPQVVEVKGGFKRVYQAFRDGKCDAAILRDSVFAALPAAQKTDLKVVHTSAGLPNQAITISKRVKNRNALIGAMTGSKGSEAGTRVLNRFSKNNLQFVQADTAEYIGHETYIEGVVWGW